MQLLNRGWNIWKRVGQFIGDIVARVILSVFYFTVFLPFGLGVRIFSDPISVKKAVKARWLDRETRDLTLDDARRLS